MEPGPDTRRGLEAGKKAEPVQGGPVGGGDLTIEGRGQGDCSRPPSLSGQIRNWRAFMKAELNRLGQRADVLLDEIKAMRIPEPPTFGGYLRWLWTGLTGGGWNYVS